MAIDVGDLAEAYDTWVGNNYSLMSRGNPANATGTIDHIEMYISSIGSGDKVTVYALTEVTPGEFDSGGSSGEFTVVLGLNTFDAPGDFTAFAITAGDFIGCYTTCALKRNASGGSDVLLDYGDEFPMDNFIFGSTYTENKLALYATGTTVAGYTIEIGSGSFIETGQIINLLKANKIGIGAGTFVWTGFVVTLTKSAAEYILNALAGAFVISGSSVILKLMDGIYTIIPIPGIDYIEETKPETDYSEELKESSYEYLEQLLYSILESYTYAQIGSKDTIYTEE